MRTIFGRAIEKRSNPFENPSMPLTSVSLLNVFGGTPTDSGVSVSEMSAFGVATFWRCAMTLAGLVAGFPLKVYEADDKAEIPAPALSHPASGTAYEQWETVMLHLLAWGNAYMQKVRNGLGKVVDLVPIHPARVRIDIVAGHKVFVVTNPAGAPTPYTTAEIMHIPGPSVDGIKGLGVVAMARQSIGIGMAADAMAAKLFGNGSLISGMLTTDRVLKPDEAQALKQRWKDTIAGSSHAHDVAVMGAGTKFQPLSMSPTDSQFLQSRQWQALEICRWFGMPPHLAMLVDKSTSWGTGIEQQNIGLLKFTVRPWTYRIEQRVTLEIVGPDSQYAEFETDDLLKADTPTRYAAYQSAIMTGWMTRNEARRRENLPPLEGLDEPLIPTVAPPMLLPAPAEPEPDATDTNDTDPEGVNA